MPLSTTQGAPLRQSHADAVLWYKLSDASGALKNSGTATSADLTVTGPGIQYAIPGPLGDGVFVEDATTIGAEAVSPGSGATTVWAWVTLPEVQLPRWIWGKRVVSGGEARATLTIDTGVITATLKTASGTYTTSSTASTPPVAGVPMLIALAYDGSKLRLYVDGVLSSGTEASGLIIWTNETPGQVAWKLGSAGDSWAGIYHEAGAYDGDIGAHAIAVMKRRGMGWRA
jgi:hypothetical protein